ncbi:MAG: lysophospholipid acyltransferase family protein [Anaeroplasma sp.]
MKQRIGFDPDGNLISRGKRVFRKNFIYIFYLNNKCKRIVKNDLMSFKDRHSFAIKWLKKYHKDFKVKIDVTGLENITDDIKGCIFVCNHQGRDDCPIVLHALEKIPTSFLINSKVSNGFLIKHICDMLNSKRIDFDDLKSQIKVYNEMVDEIKAGYKYIIFPEAGYTDNKNTMSTFNTPCFVPAIKSKCPIIPICLYDSWRVFLDPSKDFVHVGCHILKPIYYDEYKDLKKNEIAALAQERIQIKLNELNEIYEVDYDKDSR